MVMRRVVVVAVVSVMVGCGGSGSKNGDGSTTGGDGATVRDGGPLVGDGGVDSGSGDDAAYPADFGPPSAGAQRVLDQLDTYANGGTIDDDGNGTPDVTVTVASDGTHTVSVDTAAGVARQSTVRTSPTDWTLEGDQDGDGVADERITSSLSGNVVTIVWEKDTDGDQSFDWRSTVTTDVSTAGARPQTFTVDELLTPIGGGARAYTTTSAYKNNSPEAACTPTSPVSSGDGGPNCWYDDLPQTWAAAVQKSIAIGFGEHFRVMTSGAMRCNVTQIGRLAQALDRALVDLDNLAEVNLGYRDVVRQVLSEAPILYGCANPSCLPGNVIATTRSPGQLPFAPTDVAGITSISPATLAETVDGVEEIILHEWFHTAGYSHTPDFEGDAQRDYIYSCSRHANKCRGYPQYYLGVKTDASSARDAAMCADLSNKPRFGNQPIFVDSDVGYIQTNQSTMPVPPLCATSNMVQPTGNCQCHLMEKNVFCDQTPMSEAQRNAQMKYDTFACCETCPAPTSYNDASCAGSGAKPTKHWAVPACQKIAGCNY